MTSFSIATTETNDQGENALLLCFFFSYVTSNILEKFPKDYDIIFSESPVASQFSMVHDIGILLHEFLFFLLTLFGSNKLNFSSLYFQVTLLKK
jgi:hypothetical protein